MVATRRGAKKAAEPAPAASNTLSAPPKRGRKQAVVEEAAAEEAAAPAAPAPAVTKTTKKTSTAVKRKAEAEPEDVELPPKKKPTAANTKATRAAKVQTKAKAAHAPKRATRGQKAAAEPALAQEPVIVIEEEPAVEEAPKRRGRKAAIKQAPAPKVEQPVADDEDELMMDLAEAPKPAPRGRKAAAKKPATKTVKKATTAVEKPAAAELVKPASRARKAAAPKPSLPAPVASSRPTRGRNAAVAVAQDSPLKKPARKPATKKKAAVAKAEPEPEPTPAEPVEEVVEDEFAEYPNYPTTPAHIKAPILEHVVDKAAFDQLPGYPKTPSHIKAPVLPMVADTEEVKEDLAVYVNTPAQQANEVGTAVQLIESQSSAANTPVRKAVSSDKVNFPEQVEEADVSMEEAISSEQAEQTNIIMEEAIAPEHIEKETVTVEDAVMSEDVEEAVISEDVEHATINTEEVISPEHVEDAPLTIKEASTPVQIDAINTTDVDVTMDDVPNHSATLARIATPKSSRKALAELSVEQLNTPAPLSVATPTTIGLSALGPDCFGTPLYVSSPAFAEGVSGELAVGDQTHEQLVWGITNQEAFEELPSYPKTPTHIANKAMLAELPSYANTPAHALEAALQEEITASVKKQTPSPQHFNMSFGSVDLNAFYEEDSMEVDSELPTSAPAEVSVTEPVAKLQFAPVDLSATVAVPDLASPKKSALRSPQKMEVKTPKKAVTWHDEEEEEENDHTDLFGYNNPLRGLTFFVDVTSNGKQHNYVFASLIQDLGAKTVNNWEDGVTHVLFKEGNVSTLEKVLATNGAVKCINVGWVLECESNKARVDESPYLVDLTPAMPASPLPVATMNPYTPARTPSKYALPPSTGCRSIPSTPTSSEFDRSLTMEDNKENENISFHYTSRVPKTCPTKKTSSFLFSRSAMKTPTRPNFLGGSTPRQPLFAGPQTTGKKRSLESSSLGLNLSATPAKKFRLF